MSKNYIIFLSMIDSSIRRWKIKIEKNLKEFFFYWKFLENESNFYKIQKFLHSKFKILQPFPSIPKKPNSRIFYCSSNKASSNKVHQKLSENFLNFFYTFLCPHHIVKRNPFQMKLASLWKISPSHVIGNEWSKQKKNGRENVLFISSESFEVLHKNSHN